MRQALFIPVLFVVLLFVALSGCDSTEERGGGIVTLEGQVLNLQTNNPVVGAFVRVMPIDVLLETNAQGRFSGQVEIDSTMELDLTASREGFQSETISLLAVGGRVVTVPPFRLRQLQAEGPESGKAASILLLSQTISVIGVKESGSREVANITFQAVDSLGRPIVLENEAEISFQLGERPNGGEYIFPEREMTDNQGRVTVNLASGTRAGVVQIVAEANVDGRIIRSKPVSTTIHGGLPDQEHFSIGPARFNFPGLRAFGLINEISVVVGDKYANPVKPGTSVYFTTTHGVVEGSVLTNQTGRGTVQLISGNPLPSDGIAIITGRTADENQERVSGSTPVVFSGVPVIRVSPTVATLGQTYLLTVTDQNGNPLVEGTSITVRVEGTRVKAVGNTEVTLDDTAFLGGMGYNNVVRGPGITEFTFSAVKSTEDDGLGQLDPPVVESITIRVTGENGDLELVLGKAGVPQATTDGAQVEIVRGGTEVVARASMDRNRPRR